MKTCTYNINGTWYTYDKAIDYILQNESLTNAFGDTVFAAANTRQQNIKSALEQIKEENKYEINPDKNNLGEGELSFKGVDNKKVYSLQGFVNSDKFTDDYGNQVCTPLNKEDFKQYIIAQETDPNNPNRISVSDAEIKADKIIASWDLIAEDATILHTILSRFYQNTLDLEEDLKGTRFEGLASILLNKKKAARDQVADITRSKGTFIYNLNLKTHIPDLNIDVIGHIDAINIDPDGNIQIINYKITTNFIQEHKEKHYKFSLALLKQMVIDALAQKGVGVKTENINVAIVPIKLAYDKEFNGITSIDVQSKLSEIGTAEGRYYFDKFDKVAKKHVNPQIVIEELTLPEKELVDEQLGIIIPSQKLTIQGIQITAENWIKNNLNTAIVQVNEVNSQGQKVYYKIVFNENDVVDITDYHRPLENKQVKEAVQSRLKDLYIGNSYISAKNIVRLIKTGIEKKGKFNFQNNPAYKRCGKYFDKILKPYFTAEEDEDGNYNPDWELIEDDLLVEANILMFRNKKTYKLDVITISPYDLDATAKLRNRYTNILGEFIGDNVALQEGIKKSTYGNLEMLRTMLVLNQVIPKIQGDYKLGFVQILSPENINGHPMFTFQNAIKDFTKITSIVKKHEGDKFKFKNNFSGAKFYDAIDVFLRELSKVDEEFRDKVLSDEWGGTILQDAYASRLQKLEALKSIMKAMEQEFGLSSLNELDSFDDKVKVNLYKHVAQAVLQYSNLEQKIDFNEVDMDSAEINFMGSANLSSQNARIITGLFAQTADAIAENAYKATRPVASYLTKYYKACGYSNFENSTIGDQARVFKRLYEEVDGKKTMRFKNPWTDDSLQPHEREFLKQALFSFAQVRARMFPGKETILPFSTYNDPKIPEFINTHPWYLEVPLMKASKATDRMTGQAFKEWKTRMLRIFHPSQLGKNFQEVIDGIYSEEEKAKVEEDFAHLNTANRYGWYESLNSSSERQIALTRGTDFFETNVEELLMNFITAQEEAEHMADFMCQAKAVILTMNTIGQTGSPKLKNTLKYINDFISINAYNRSINEESSKKVLSVITPARRLATTMYIMGNISSAVRDLTEGVLQNSMRAIIHYQTNISKKSLAKAYQIVVKDGTLSNVRSLNLLNQLNIKYRISNVDLARIQEVLSTGRGGILNYENWLYATLRRPDFVNRMTLFVARMIEDGVWDAMSINENGDLEYDWTKDGRYSYYAEHKDNPPVNDEKFLHQKGAYYSAILEYNEEHPNNPLNIQDPNVALPSPYTNVYVESIKTVANSIYGSYDKSTKSMWEFIAVGQSLGQFTTWMNGMIGNYFRKPGTPTGEVIRKQATNEVGEPLYLDGTYFNILVQRTRDDGTKYYFNESTNEEYTGQVLPLMKNVPVVGQGIMFSVLSLFKKVLPTALDRMETEGIQGLVDEINKEIIKNPEELKNFKKLLFSDILVTLFMASLFHWGITPAYNELKKNRPHDDFLMNSFEDIVYKGTASSYDGFKGPVNIVTTYGENMNPPAYKVTTKMVTDVFKTTFGDKTLGQLLTQNIPLLRSFRHAYDAYIQA